MSGFAAVYRTDGAPVDPALLDRMAAFLRFRGPDDHAVEVLGPDGSVGLVHTMFRTTWEAGREHQPCTLEGEAWVAGHIRIDAREDLWPKLEARGCEGVRQETDAGLLLYAYQTWGEGCVEQLLGDFSFALWDARERKLFCARDHMGVRPLFYAQCGEAWVVSNMLDCVRLYPGIPDDLDDVWVADFLMFGQSASFDRSVWSAIRRLPPAHTLTVRPDGAARIRRYWKLELNEPLYLKRHEEYCERFRELVQEAVKDRLRTSRVGIYLSGGLDSPTLAATAARLVPDPARNLLGYTFVFKELIPDDEEHYVRLVADHLGIPVLIRNKDNACYDPEWWRQSIRTPEPDWGIVCKRAELEFAAEMAREARVWFYGEGPDNALRFEWQAYLSWLKANRQWRRMAKDIASLFWLDSPGSILADAWRRFRHPQKFGPPPVPEFPGWLRPEFVDRLQLKDRWNAYWAVTQGTHPWHPWAYASFTGPLWPNLFERFEPVIASQRQIAETRHPYVDLRVVRFLLSVPVVPWARRKLLERRAMALSLPRSTLGRLKTALRSDPWASAMQGFPVPQAAPPEALLNYLDVERIPAAWQAGAKSLYNALYAVSMCHWASTTGLFRCGAPG